MAVHEDVTKKLYGSGNNTTDTNVSKVQASGSVGYIDQIPGW